MADWKAAVEACGFVFTTAFDGLAPPLAEGEAEVEAQCRRVYSNIVSAAAARGAGADRMVRLDHFTQSQSWLAVRQRVRASFFGKPAPLASTGVPVRMATGNLLRAAGIGWAGASAPRVLLSGEAFGMPAISTAVRAGPCIFVSGILAREPGTFQHNLAKCMDDIARVLRQLGTSPDHILRMDAYVASASDAAAWKEGGKARLGGTPVVRTMGAAFEEPAIEVNLLLAAPMVDRQSVSLGEGAVLTRAGGLAVAGHSWEAATTPSLADLLDRLPGQSSLVGRVDVAGDLASPPTRRLKEVVLVAAPAAPIVGSEPAMIFEA